MHNGHFSAMEYQPFRSGFAQRSHGGVLSIHA
jgi:hypothetical protein